MKPDLHVVEGAAEPQSRLFGSCRSASHGPECVCGGRETRFVQPGLRECVKCGLVEFRITRDGYRGVRVVRTRAGASPQERLGLPRSRKRAKRRG